jgi:hypothetical protein
VAVHESSRIAEISVEVALALMYFVGFSLRVHLKTPAATLSLV